MYFQIGGDMAVRAETIVGVFDLDNTSWSHRTRAFLQRAEKEGSVISVTDELPKSFVLVREMGLERVYLTQFSSATLEKRIAEELK